MFDTVKPYFVKVVGDGHDPKTIPAHIVEFYDKSVDLFRKFGAYIGVDDVPESYWPLICILADQKKRIDELEERFRLSTLPPVGAPAVDAVQDADNPCVAGDFSEHAKVDLRTREGRALKAQMAVA